VLVCVCVRENEIGSTNLCARILHLELRMSKGRVLLVISNGIIFCKYKLTSLDMTKRTLPLDIRNLVLQIVSLGHEQFHSHGFMDVGDKDKDDPFST